MILAVEIMAIMSMFVLMFTGIWGFIVVIKMHNQLKYRNYILEKLSENVFLIASTLNNENSSIRFPDEASSLIKDELNHNISNVSSFKK